MAFVANNQKPVWLGPDVLQRTTYSQGGAEPDVAIRLRAYEMWKHAEQVLSLPISELQRVDALTTVKRFSSMTAVGSGRITKPAHPRFDKRNASGVE